MSCGCAIGIRPGIARSWKAGSRSWWIIVALLTAALVMGRAASILLLAFISYLALKEYLSIIPTRRQDRAVLFFVYLAIPVQFWLVWAEWYGLFIIFVPVYMFMFLGAAMVMLGHTSGFLKASGMLHWGIGFDRLQSRPSGLSAGADGAWRPCRRGGARHRPDRHHRAQRCRAIRLGQSLRQASDRAIGQPQQDLGRLSRRARDDGARRR